MTTKKNEGKTCKDCGGIIGQTCTKYHTQPPLEGWAEEFDAWYRGVYPAVWKSHMVIDKIRSLLSTSTKAAKEEERKRVVEILEEKKIGLPNKSGFTDAAALGHDIGIQSAIDILTSIDK